jgi:DNA invertase Pin-like site-specific DNA recombinase
MYRRLATNFRANKLAVMYLRSTTETNGAETTKRALTALALRLGWSWDRLLVIDEDRACGVSEQRPGFKRMLRLIDAGEVGLVVVRDLSRISRDAHQASVFLAKARAAGVSVCTSDGIVA